MVGRIAVDVRLEAFLRLVDTAVPSDLAVRSGAPLAPRRSQATAPLHLLAARTPETCRPARLLLLLPALPFAVLSSALMRALRFARHPAAAPCPAVGGCAQASSGGEAQSDGSAPLTISAPFEASVTLPDEAGLWAVDLRWRLGLRSQSDATQTWTLRQSTSHLVATTCRRPGVNVDAPQCCQRGAAGRRRCALMRPRHREEEHLASHRAAWAAEGWPSGVWPRPCAASRSDCLAVP